MNNMKRTTMAAAVLVSVGAGAVQAYPIKTWYFNGTFTMYTPTGSAWGGDPAVTGNMTLDMGTGSGTAWMMSSTPFSGYMWTAHDITLQAVAPDVMTANMLFDWNGNLNIPVVVDFSMILTGPYYTFTIATLDGNGDGVPGYPMTSGPFPGWNATFGGAAYESTCYLAAGYDVHSTCTPPPPPIPVPATIWLFGSGLVGLVGISRRKKSRINRRAVT